MAVYRSFADLAKGQDAGFRRSIRSIQTNHQRGAEMVRDAAVKMVSGSTTSKDLRAMGSPFSRGPGRRSKGFGLGMMPLLPINVQSSDLINSARLFQVRPGVWQFQFTSPHAVVLTPGGTKNMIDRQFWPTLNLQAGRIFAAIARKQVDLNTRIYSQ